MPEGTRPDIRVPYTLHGAMREVAEEHDRTLDDTYIVAVKFFVGLSDEVDYDPNDDPLLEDLWENCYEATAPTDD